MKTIPVIINLPFSKKTELEAYPKHRIATRTGIIAMAGIIPPEDLRIIACLAFVYKINGKRVNSKNIFELEAYHMMNIMNWVEACMKQQKLITYFVEP